MDNQYTKGAWRWSPGCNFVISEHGKVICENVSPTHPLGGPEHTQETLANARMIAKAPEMYRLLRAALFREDVADSELGYAIESLLKQLDGE